MDKDYDKRKQLLAHLMASSGAASPAESKEHLLRPWRRLARHLSPLIGESGFCALFGRTSRLVQPESGWLAALPASKSIDGLIVALVDGFGAVNADAARAANGALLDTFTALLSDLIGEALTIRLLHSAAYGEDEQKNAQENK